MPREFVPFDVKVIDDEFDALRRSSSTDAAKLEFCINHFEEVSPKENPSPAMIESFGEGFKELRHEKGAYKGRLLFYEPNLPKGTEDLVMLVLFRKQTQKTPGAEIRKALRRMAQDIARRRAMEG
jgi:phage-related protein